MGFLLVVAGCSSSASDAATSASAKPSAQVEFGEVTMPKMFVKVQAPVEVKSGTETPNTADTNGETFLGTITVGKVPDDVQIRFYNDRFLVPKSPSVIEKDPDNKNIEKLPGGAIAYLDGPNPTVWLPLKDKPSVTCVLDNKLDKPSAVELAWKICKSMRPLDGG